MKILHKNNPYFKVLNLSDPQLGDEEWPLEPSQLMIDTVTKLIGQIQPDLITVSGDIAWPGNYESYSNFVNFIDGFRIPWAPVFGNHDLQDGHDSVMKTIDIFSKSPYCLFESGDPKLGYGNYVIGIEENGKLIHGIIMMDSHDRMDWVNPQGETQECWAQLYPEQFDWYAGVVDQLQAQGAKETSIVMHIPIYTYREAMKAALKEGIDPDTVPPGKGEQVDCWNEGYEDSFGVLYEGISSFPVDNGFFDLILAKNSTKHVLCGHDHVNNLSVNYKGVRLTFSMKAGMGCYWNKNLNGGTVLTIDSDGKLQAEHHYIPVE